MNRREVFRALGVFSMTAGVVLAAGSLIPSSATAPPADLVLRNGRIVTLNAGLAAARALAVRDGRIVALGSEREIDACIGPRTEVIDLDGACAVPGLIESHAHFESLGRSRLRCDLRAARSWEEVVAVVAEAAARTAPGEWIVGRGWHQEKWNAGVVAADSPPAEARAGGGGDSPPGGSGAGMPHHEALSRVSPANPVLLTHASGHAVIANALAMQRAGVTAASLDPEGGTILRDARGQPTGVFLEAAAVPIQAALARDMAARPPERIEAEWNQIIAAAGEACLENGITTFCDAGAEFETIGRYRRAAENGRLRVRLWAALSASDSALASRLDEVRTIGACDHHFTVRAIKRLYDGALGSRGALLLEPYSDDRATAGLQMETPASLEAIAGLARAHGYQLCTHAIGDRANREVLDVYARVGSRDLRWRIEHAQHLAAQDIPRFGELGVIASMQPCHCTSDGPWVPKRIGETRAAEGAYVWRKLLASGARLCCGTDAPVEPLDPPANLYAAVTRRMPDGTCFHPDQCLTREEVLRAYTWDAAYAAFEESLKGSLEPGKLADITIFDRDILTVPEEELREARVVATIVGGEVRYRAKR